MLSAFLHAAWKCKQITSPISQNFQKFQFIWANMHYLIPSTLFFICTEEIKQIAEIDAGVTLLLYGPNQDTCSVSPQITHNLLGRR